MIKKKGIVRKEWGLVIPRGWLLLCMILMCFSFVTRKMLSEFLNGVPCITGGDFWHYG